MERYLKENESSVAEKMTQFIKDEFAKISTPKKTFLEWVNSGIEKRTDVLYEVQGAPFITLIESKMPNLWYHPDKNEVYSLTSRGFKLCRYTDRTILLQKGFI